ncbi:hypothetical protein C8P63_106117 [Melghirimyces profundicolus]|uniref:Uncharacterized protein n=1 Tax=Melghirimyces profundicolus TaxID=1242148 RepID=A0A2T6C0L6_9BACL|nr:hypothetical protein C8P63_106117 [Melghirimyces profundicolus]
MASDYRKVDTIYLELRPSGPLFNLIGFFPCPQNPRGLGKIFYTAPVAPLIIATI